MTRLPERLPAALSERLSSATQSIYARQGREVDVAIGGIPFRLATYPDVPQSIETIPVRKDQFDAENDPGEQSLSGWWRRSQSSWHEGAGNLYQESSEQNIANNGFFESSGIDVFTPGQMTLLKAMKRNAQPAAAPLSRVKVFTVNSVRTNLCTNPNFTANATGYTVADGGTPGNAPTITRDTTHVAAVGTTSGRIDWNADDALGIPPSVIVPTQDVTAGAIVTASARVFVPTGSPAIRIVGNGVLGTSTGVVFNDYVTLTLTTTADEDGHIEVAFWPVTPAGVGKKAWFGSILIEADTTVVGSYFDGNSVGGAWLGSANNSASTETHSSSSVSLSAVGAGALHTAPTVDGAYTALHDPTPTIVDGLISGATFYDIASDGTLYQGAISAPGSATTWPLGTTPSRLGWGKHRLWVIGGRKLWQPNLSLSGGTTQDPIFVNPNQGWQYTCMAEGPAAMYFGGHDGNVSTIQAVTLDSGGAIPTLSGAAITAALPDGELVQEIAVVAGQLIGIGTNRGFRVGAMSDTGTITYGPLLIEPNGVDGCTALCSQGRFFVVAFRTTDGNALAYRVDTANPLAEGIYPYASDIDCGFTGSITSLAGSGSRQLACTTNDGLAWYQSSTEFVSSGYLLTGRVRYRTTELKSFKFLGVEIQPLQGQIACSFVKEGDTALPLGSITKQGEQFTDAFEIKGDPMRYASVRFDLAPTTDKLQAPVINSYLLRALPSVAPQRMITLPLMCFDMEQAQSGQKYGGAGFAQDRLMALQTLEDAADLLVFQNFTLTGDDGMIVAIESMRFVQTAPGPTSRNTGPGGILILQLRTVGG